MLRSDVVAAVAEGKFHIYPIESIDQGVEVLTDSEAGTPGKGGKYPAHTVYGRVERRLARMARDMKAASRPSKADDKEGEVEKEGFDDKPDEETNPG